MISAYPSQLKPTGTQLFQLNDKTFEVPKTIMTFKQWEGIPINTFGGKPLIDFDGKPMFAELAIMKLFIISGWQARWIETYGASDKTPFHFSDWIDGKLSEQLVDVIQDNNVLKTLNAISILNSNKYGNSYSGCWDVLGWLDGQIIFAECKRSKKDFVRKTQNNWLSAAIDHGLKLENFLVVEWDFAI
jgi:hypothetical protein